ncbi:YdcF family protein [Devosia sp. XJ19-1]|uniref:YdcF family protein n=1 Tax=Devosia ureilytica TaxID=2952754 RepID=A0A9Q4APB7_9HYPH|nr:YdcF family protein [Devosia ureilytica]MCP8884029.1 YdcF family protein [Devosia ureilytica]MCP8887637.1 YdcF family protein [Devosia ureilytica]
MFFVLSKVFWLLAQPLSLVLLMVLAGLVLVLLHRRRSAVAALALAGIFVALLGYTSLGYLLIQPLEDRFAVPGTPPERVGAIIMLGGATNSHISAVRSMVAMNDAGERLTTTLWLANRYPEATIVLSGGGGALEGSAESEAETAERFFIAHGISQDRLVLEGHSRNTIENAANSRQLIEEGAGDILLVTSGFHMPRSVGLFRAQGVPVIPWPTDYRSIGNEVLGPDLANPSRNFETASIAIREWIGLLIYRLTGQIEEVFPAP